MPKLNIDYNVGALQGPYGNPIAADPGDMVIFRGNVFLVTIRGGYASGDPPEDVSDNYARVVSLQTGSFGWVPRSEIAVIDRAAILTLHIRPFTQLAMPDIPAEPVIHKQEIVGPTKRAIRKR
jgi:hypothetical protein